MTPVSTIALDGPAASGKTTVGARLARDLNYLLFDTGVMYRAATLVALRTGTPIRDEAGVTVLTERLMIDVQPPAPDTTDGRLYTVLVDGKDVTHEIRSPEVDANVSPVSAYPGVRAALTEQQRRIGERGRIVMVGRDIGTVVLPRADLKIYLDASPQERARRRFLDCQAREEETSDDSVLSSSPGLMAMVILRRQEETSYESVLAAVLRRDEIDSGREHAPLCAAEDAVVIDSTGLTVAGVVARIEALIEEWTEIEPEVEPEE